MIKGFISKHWYRYNGDRRGNGWNSEGQMDFALDNRPHRCNDGQGYVASFFDSPDPMWEWIWDDLSLWEEVSEPDPFLI